MADNKKNLFVRHEVPDQDKHIQEKKKKKELSTPLQKKITCEISFHFQMCSLV